MEAIWLLLTMGVTLGVVIGIAVKLFELPADPRQEAVLDLLPGANCGGCGLAGCADFARATVSGSVMPAACPVNSQEAVEKICNLLGLTAGAHKPNVALVRCRGDHARARRNGNYNGVLDCRHAMLVAGGAKGCSYGCLGLGSCARVCPFHAIEMTADGMAIVHPELCTGCGKCVAACPRHLVALVPKDAPVHVLCNSPEKGADKKKVCDVACIGCRKCAKAAGDDRIVIDGMLARVNYNAAALALDIVAVCPTQCLQTSLLLSDQSLAVKEELEVVNA